MQQRIERLERMIQSAVDHKRVFGAVVRMESGDGQWAWSGAAGNLNIDSRFFIASTTKLFVTATLLKLRERNDIRLTDKIGDYLDEKLLSGIHHDQGTDYSKEITIEQLMAHTSGLPDYFQQKRVGGKSLADEILAGQDQAWTFEQAIENSKQLKPAFPPRAKGKALYSDSNYQLLGKIIETVTSQPLDEVFRQYIYEPLSLTNTYIYSNSEDQSPSLFYYKNAPLHVPLAMTSFGPDGGIVSTAEELTRFLRAFFEGKLFPKSALNELYEWNRIFFPLQYGKGIVKFQLPRAFSPFKPQPELIGHSGLSGAFAYCAPKKDIYLCGTVNQTNMPSLPYKLMLGLLSV
ncbi:serine hydrolase domain-containing protein [Paenibacillus sp. NPDC058071]|uniref:serine hydrolase domain-containing protein n=1 Tax=Paenibacillus sp. NPDC058071 TaxID=3346326 RepID=UPI0036DB8487